MEFRRLGSSDLEVSEISLGSWLTYGAAVERSRGRTCVWRALDAGINLLDTANVYGRGAAESFLGETLAGMDRSSYLLATKVFFPMSPQDQGLSAAQIRTQLDSSLRRLQTDYIDLYQCHRYDDQTPLEETMTALTGAVQAGKVRCIGFSEWSAEQIQASVEMASSCGLARFVSSQPQYSMLCRRPEAEVIALCARSGISQIVWSPLAQGVLTGKYPPGQPAPRDSRAASESMGQMMGDLRDEAVLRAVERLKPVAEDAGVSMAQLALAWVLREPNVASAIIGATGPEQVEHNAGASGVALSPEILGRIDEVLEPVIVR
ncbi:MAG: aldo/keto reductase family protein [Candidatus Dormibacteria bacterium]